MASKRGIRRKACGKKIRFPDAEAASKARSSLHRNKGYQGMINVYRCQFCGSYHIGHAPRAGQW
jgi:rubrerythrin